MKSRTRILAGSAIVALMAGSAFAESYGTTDSTRAAEDEGAVVKQGSDAMSDAKAGTNDMPAVSDTSRAAADDETGMSTVDKDTAAGTATGPKSDVTLAETPLEDMTVGDVVGKNVISALGNDVGEIDYVIEQNGTIAGVVGVGGFLGLGEHSVAIPLSQFDVTRNGQLQLDSQTEAQLRDMPEINENGISPLDDDLRIGDIS